MELVELWDRNGSGEGHFTSGMGLQFYLAQTPIVDNSSAACSSGSQQASAAAAPAAPLAHLQNDIDTPELLRGLPGFQLWQSNLWLGTSPSSSATHFDSNHNLLCIVKGTKTVALHPPNDVTSVQAAPVYSGAYHHASTSASSGGRAWRAVLTRGQALYIPEGWWHTVDSTPVTIAVNIWWEGLRATAVDTATAIADGNGGGVESGDEAADSDMPGCYLGRLCLSRQVDCMKEIMLKKALHGFECRQHSAEQTKLLGSGLDDSSGLDHWGRDMGTSVEWLRSGASDVQARAFMRGARIPLQVATLQQLAAVDAGKLRLIFSQIDPMTAHALTTGWEALDATLPDNDRQMKDFYGKIGDVLDDGWDVRLLKLVRSRAIYFRLPAGECGSHCDSWTCSDRVLVFARAA